MVEIDTTLYFSAELNVLKGIQSMPGVAFKGAAPARSSGTKTAGGYWRKTTAGPVWIEGASEKGPYLNAFVAPDKINISDGVTPQDWATAMMTNPSSIEGGIADALYIGASFFAGVGMGLAGGVASVFVGGVVTEAFGPVAGAIAGIATGAAVAWLGFQIHEAVWEPQEHFSIYGQAWGGFSYDVGYVVGAGIYGAMYAYDEIGKAPSSFLEGAKAGASGGYYAPPEGYVQGVVYGFGYEIGFNVQVGLPWALYTNPVTASTALLYDVHQADITTDWLIEQTRFGGF